ncbi:hypothetical protein [Saccharothrix lopnurensis]|uniref:DUF3558 domain-containing protein n=1 Tax=Saccharothrix lopnurensis TaxID=1670621 RepID=A0ABW1P8D4_9PSEU
MARPPRHPRSPTREMIMYRRFSAVLPLLGTALLLSACTSGGDIPPLADTAQSTGTGQVPAGSAIEQSIPERDRDTAEAYAAFRAIDACALHDVEAATAVTGDKGDEITPDQDGLNGCILRLHKSEFESTWTVFLEVGILFPPELRHEAAPETVGGMAVFTREDERGCALSKPLDDNHAIEVRTSTYSGATKKPCDVLREYVGKLGEVWNDPPRRDSGRTSPRLSLADVDPCVAASAVLDGVGPSAQLSPKSVFACSAVPASAAPSKKSTDIEIALIMDEDPASLVAAGAREVTIGSHRAVLIERATGCLSYVVWEPETEVVVDRQSGDALPSLQQIRVRAGTCEAAQAAAEKVLAKIGRR